MITGKTPKKINLQINKIINLLGLDSDKESKFNPELNNCHINNFVKRKLYGGTIVYGWTFYQDKVNNFTEAMFHSVWRNDNGKLIDITPRIDQEKRIMFIPDQSREVKTRIYKNQPVLETFDNVRLHNDEFSNKLKPILGSVGNNLAYEHRIVPILLTKPRNQ